MTRLKDITGQRTGMVVPIRYAGNGKWLCQCDCGSTKELATGGLRTNKTQSCGCARTAQTVARNKLGRVAAQRDDLSGQAFGMLFVLGASDRTAHWLCRCACGVQKVVQHHNLTRGVTRSCGCLLREQNAKFRRYESRAARDQACNERKRVRRNQDESYAEHIRQNCRKSARIQYGTSEGRLRAANKCALRRVRCGKQVITLVQWLRLVEAWDNRCAYCQKAKKLTLDHVVALENGGQHVLENIVPACISCNGRKSDLELHVALQRIGCVGFYERREAADQLLKDMNHA